MHTLGITVLLVAYALVSRSVLGIAAQETAAWRADTQHGSSGSHVSPGAWQVVAWILGTSVLAYAIVEGAASRCP